MADHQWLSDETPEAEQQLIKAGVTTVARLVQSAGEVLGLSAMAARNVIADTIVTRQQNLAATRIPIVEASPVVEATYDEVVEVTNGFFEGIVDVFPYESNPNRCRTNFTVGYDAFSRLFLEDRTIDFASASYQEDLVTDVSYLLKLPFGVSYSCYWGFSTVIKNPVDDTLSEED